jgi:hypothetical protein
VILLTLKFFYIPIDLKVVNIFASLETMSILALELNLQAFGVEEIETTQAIMLSHWI